MAAGRIITLPSASTAVANTTRPDRAHRPDGTKRAASQTTSSTDFEPGLDRLPVQQQRPPRADSVTEAAAVCGVDADAVPRRALAHHQGERILDGHPMRASTIRTSGPSSP
jgi:hypothetical protein